jgi:AcrR family transcriptional regulator
MSADARPLRADAERNRRRLLDAAEALFRERGLDVGVGEIAQQAGVGRGTLFRNFPSKEHLIAAIVIERMGDAARAGRELLTSTDPSAAVFTFLEDIIGRQQLDRGLFEAVGDTFLANAEIRAAYADLIGALEELVTRAQAAGAIRPDIAALDVMMMTKGICQAAGSFAHVDPDLGARQLDLVRAAISSPGEARPLRGQAPTFDDLEKTFPAQADAGLTSPKRAAQ